MVSALQLPWWWADFISSGGRTSGSLAFQLNFSWIVGKHILLGVTRLSCASVFLELYIAIIKLINPFELHYYKLTPTLIKLVATIKVHTPRTANDKKNTVFNVVCFFCCNLQYVRPYSSYFWLNILFFVPSSVTSSRCTLSRCTLSYLWQLDKVIRLWNYTTSSIQFCSLIFFIFEFIYFFIQQCRCGFWPWSK